MKKKEKMKKPLNVKKVTISKLSMANLKGGEHDPDPWFSRFVGICW